MGNGGFENRIIIRTGIGSVRPLNPQSQHDSDFTSAVQTMCSNIDIIRLEDPKDIYPDLPG